MARPVFTATITYSVRSPVSLMLLKDHTWKIGSECLSCPQPAYRRPVHYRPAHHCCLRANTPVSTTVFPWIFPSFDLFDLGSDHAAPFALITPGSAVLRTLVKNS